MESYKCMCEIPTVIHYANEPVVYCRCGGYIEANKPKGRKVEPFDITQHNWSDGDIESSFITNDKQRLNFSFDSSVMPTDVIGFNRSDAIAIARHFKLTEGDIK